ncbi:lysosomal alpha-mannosidase-like [Rhynchophorus ferrugineus]|uniref:lysosomal alpha-mannosidase-like n=1 Tax=Rhynchophorus ferrugineus TaxID=354439 RepID=UPI003FCE69D2
MREISIIFLPILLVAVIQAFPSKPLRQSSCGYESCHPVKDGFINVHIVPHTHDDVGWLKTVDQYYYGSNTNNQRAGVQYILQTVMDSLRKNEDRRFIYVETAFFWKWWIKQSDSIKEEVKNYVNNGRLEFIGGGWSMNDEAATHYHSIIDQMAWGLRRLNDTFGECGRPKIGWQIDPFGHSKEMANIFAQLGFDGFLVGRIDYHEKDYRWKTQTPEMVWRGSKSLGESTDIFTGVLYNRYSPPPGFCFDLLCSDTPFIDDPKSFEYNVDDRVNDFINYVTEASKVYTTNNILITMGDDFNYQDAEAWFINLDKLIYYVNQRQETGSKFNLIYSTPSCYVKAVNEETQNQNWLLKEDDFFPYASDEHSYWTGYFISRPAVKRFERIGNNFLQVCKQLYTLADLGADDSQELNDLREVMGVLQHHDAVAGTEKQHVADDYSRQLQRALNECANITSTALNKLLSVKSSTGKSVSEKLPLNSCLLANVSQCAISENSDTFVVTIYNPLSRAVNKVVTLPVKDGNYDVLDQDGNSLTIDVLPIPSYVANIPGRASSATHDLYFVAEDVPPLGWKSFIVSSSQSNKKKSISSSKPNSDSGSAFKIDDNGLVNSVTINGVTIELDQNFYYYNGFVGDNSNSDKRSSGAYVFRPDGDIKKVSEQATVSTVEGQLVFEARQQFNDYVSQTVRVNTIESYIEFDWIIGPIPTNNPNGIEIVSRYSTKLATNGTFYTDSNGKEMLKRVRDYRPMWDLKNSESASGNYYPITAKIAIKDEEQGIEVAVLNDRAQGGGSLNDGEVEIMIHRNCLHDDAFGVGEALNEQAFGQGLVIRGSHYITVGSTSDDNGESISAIEKDIAQRKLLDAWTFLTPLETTIEDYKSKYLMTYSGLNNDLPKNIQILTLEPWKDSTYLLRIEHVFDNDEDSSLSEPVLVKLKDLFVGFNIASLKETTLGGNQWLKDSKRLKFNTNSKLKEVLNINDKTDSSKAKTSNLQDDIDNLEIVLNPSDIRTFIIDITRI